MHSCRFVADATWFYCCVFRNIVSPCSLGRPGHSGFGFFASECCDYRIDYTTVPDYMYLANIFMAIKSINGQ